MPLPRSITQPPSTVHGADLFFSAEPPSPRSQSSYHRHQSFSAVAPAPIYTSPSLSRSRTAPAPVPPPPPLMPMPSLPRHPPPLPALPESRAPSVPRSPIQHGDDESELATAIQMSRTESENRALRLEKLTTQEEDDLARALEESLRTARPQEPSPSTLSSHSDRFSIPSSSSSSSAASSLPVSPLPPARSLPVPQVGSRPLSTVSSHASLSTVTTPSLHDDEAFARQLAEQEETEVRDSQQNGFSSTVESDEDFARRLAAEENEEMKDDGSMNPSPPALPPTYDDAISPRPTPRPQSSDTTSFSVESLPPRTPSSASLSSTGNSIDSMPPMPLVPVRSTQSDTNISIQLPDHLDVSSPPSPSTASLPGKVETTASLSNGLETPPINANQFLDTELLRGVSVGWGIPEIGPRVPAMQGPMPNIISLPYGRCPPLHFQAPNWRHLLMLMARLPGTRVEPTVEAMAQNKFDMKLRTVIQFVRPNHNSHDWRTIIWLTIDHPAPPGPQNRKYMNNDVNVLPYSYTLSQIPTILQGSLDTPLSKAFTVPVTEGKPYPSLPITFPNLALYLQAALEESRRYMSDSSSGFRKLTKMIQLCYPGAYEADNSGEGGGMSGFFKKFGRNKQNGRKAGRGNEDVYELVTPFVAEEWG
ncbi:hypothetical protein PM082_005631 [Marasmius tenuissimus]|nr:hypothetical protein PM082_005631 [Marasmius tenuissimus]